MVDKEIRPDHRNWRILRRKEMGNLCKQTRTDQHRIGSTSHDPLNRLNSSLGARGNAQRDPMINRRDERATTLLSK
ncbi:MAG: hypothetical protein C4346_12075 [Chloroflexota bacterium]